MPEKGAAGRDNEINTQKIYKCDCYAEGLTVSYWPEEKDVIIELWVMGQNNIKSMTWMARIKEAWRVLREGRSHLAEVLLNYSTAHELAEDLLKKLKE